MRSCAGTDLSFRRLRSKDQRIEAGIAAPLNARGIPTTREPGDVAAVQVGQRASEANHVGTIKAAAVASATPK